MVSFVWTVVISVMRGTLEADVDPEDATGSIHPHHLQELAEAAGAGTGPIRVAQADSSQAATAPSTPQPGSSS